MFIADPSDLQGSRKSPLRKTGLATNGRISDIKEGSDLILFKGV